MTELSGSERSLTTYSAVVSHNTVYKCDRWKHKRATKLTNTCMLKIRLKELINWENKKNSCSDRQKWKTRTVAVTFWNGWWQQMMIKAPNIIMLRQYHVTNPVSSVTMTLTPPPSLVMNCRQECIRWKSTNSPRHNCLRCLAPVAVSNAENSRSNSSSTSFLLNTAVQCNVVLMIQL